MADDEAALGEGKIPTFYPRSEKWSQVISIHIVLIKKKNYSICQTGKTRKKMFFNCPME